jgi:tetratricopeptide (TPR) repeat protein
MVALQKQVQEVVFAVASTYEKKGDFKKAIEYYLKVEKQDDNVRFRIASCYKLLKEYEQAIQWFLKLSRTDQNLLEVVDCYKLDGRMKESIYWLFQILEPLNDNPAELTALQLIEEYKYPEKKRDYPDFPRRLSDVYVARAVMQCRADFSQARTSYEKASTLLADGGDVKTASWNILNRYQNDYKVALDILDQQRDAAERNYEDQLRRAKSEYDEAEQRYRRAQRDAEHEYASKLDDTRRELDRAEHDLRNLQGQASPSADLVAQARMRVEKTRNDYQYLVNNRTRFIDEYVRPYHRRMNEAMDSYRDIMNRRSEIIDRYIAPYKQKVAQAQDTLEKIRSLHESAYGR